MATCLVLTVDVFASSLVLHKQKLSMILLRILQNGLQQLKAKSNPLSSLPASVSNEDNDAVPRETRCWCRFVKNENGFVNNFLIPANDDAANRPPHWKGFSPEKRFQKMSHSQLTQTECYYHERETITARLSQIVLILMFSYN